MRISNPRAVKSSKANAADHTLPLGAGSRPRRHGHNDQQTRPFPGDLTLWKVGVIRGPKAEKWDGRSPRMVHSQNHITNLSHILAKEASEGEEGKHKATGSGHYEPCRHGHMSQKHSHGLE